MISTRTIIKGAAVGALITAGLAVGPQALAFTPSQQVGSKVTGVDYNGSGFKFDTLTTCSQSFTGHVTSNGGTGGFGGTISIDQLSFTNCTNGVTVTPHALPQSFGVDPVGGASMSVDVDITTPQGTCEYSSSLNGSGGGVYNFPASQNSLYQRTSGCGGPSQLNPAVQEEVRDSNGNLLGP